MRTKQAVADSLKKNTTTEEDNIKNDYYLFFTTEQGSDMLPYAYMGGCHFYNDLIKNNQDYYLYKDEVNIIHDNSSQLKEILLGFKNIVEIGPGSSFVIDHKTIPMINYAKNLEYYSVIDISQSFLDDACDFIASRVKHISISGQVEDLLQDKPLTVEGMQDKKVVLFLGGTFGNFDTKKQNQIASQFKSLTNPGDLLILTVDCNQDEDSLLRAYSNIYTNMFVNSILSFYTKINPYFDQDCVESFDVICEWSKVKKTININFIAKKDVSFKTIENGEVCIRKGQVLRGVKCRKFKESYIKELFSSAGFLLQDILRNNNMCMFILRRA